MKLPEFLHSGRVLRKITTVILAAALIVLGSGTTLFTGSASSYSEQLSALQKKQSEIKSQISSLKDNISDQQELKTALQNQIDVVQQQIDIYNDQISDLDNQIDAAQAKADALEKKLDDEKASFLARIRAMYMTGNTNTYLTILLGADDFGDYLYQSELLRSVTQYDTDIMNGIKADIQEMNDLKTTIESNKSEVEGLKSEQASKRSDLNDSMKQLNSVIGNLQEQQSSLEGKLSEYSAEVDSINAKIEAAAKAAQSSSSGGGSGSVTYSGSQFTWPCPGYYYISSPFGQRWGRLHAGIDIAGGSIYGKPIVAAADGVVTISDYSSGGYGNYVMINHGNKDGVNYSTVYGHMSSRAASTGQTVKAGQVIGYVGSTGNSTGPHLHFEIRINGTAYNPMNFFN